MDNPDLDDKAFSAGASDAAYPRKIVLLRYTGARGSITHLAAQRFKESLEQQSSGRFLVDIYPESALGNSSDMAYAMRYGFVTMHIGDPLFDIEKYLSWTTVSDDLTSYREALDQGTVREKLNAACLEAGVLFLGSISDEYYYLASDRPVEALADINGLRVAETTLPLPNLWELFEGTSYLCKKDQVFPLAQHKAIDAMHDSLQVNLSSQLPSLLPYLICLNQRIYSRLVYINRRFYDALLPEEQAMVEQAVEDTRQSVSEHVVRQNEEILSAYKNLGGSILVPTEEFQEAFRQELNNSGLLEATYGESLVTEIQAVFEAMS